MEKIFEILKSHYELVFITIGVFYTIMAFFNFGSINKYSTADSGKFWKYFIYEKCGEQGYRILNIIIGTIFVIYGRVSLILRK